MLDEKSKNQIDVLCIGDTVVEPFIHLVKAEVHCGIDNSNCTLTLPFGAKIPFEDDTICYGVGNSANAAVSIARLGLKSAIATELGNDDFGKKCLENFHNEKVDTTNVGLHENVKTNYHYVLWYPPERTILVKHNHFDRKLDVDKFTPNNVPPKFLYLSSLPADSLDYHIEIINWLKKNRSVKLVFQPGTFQMQMGTTSLAPLYQLSYLFIVNKEEAMQILNIHPEEKADIQSLLSKTQKLGPTIVCITDGPNGAYMRSNNKNYYMPIYPDPRPPFERTGCGDAFASTLTAMLALGKTPIEALAYGPINSMSVVQQIGAQKGLLTKDEIEGWLRNAPSDYRVTEI
jgi:sugar/nucleoside kinase (ribokinase family)